MLRNLDCILIMMENHGKGSICCYMIGLGFSFKEKTNTQAAVWGKGKRSLVCSGNMNPLCYEMKAIFMYNTSPGKDMPVSILVIAIVF